MIPRRVPERADPQVRYPASFNDFSVHSDFEAYRQKLAQSRDVYMGIYSSVKEKVEPSLR